MNRTSGKPEWKISLFLILSLACQSPSFASSYDDRSILDQADKLISEGKLNDARRLLDQYMAIHPPDAALVIERGLLYNGEDFRKCKESLTLALAMTKGSLELPRLLRIYIVRAYANSELNCKKEAYADIEKAIQLDPDSEEAYHIRALIKQRFEGNKEAWPDFVRAASLPRAGALIFERTADCAGAINKKDQQRKWLGLLIDKFPTYENLHKAANVFYKDHDSQRLLSTADKMIKLEPKKVIGYHLAIDALINLKNYQGAIDYAGVALKQKPNDVEMLQKRAHVYMILHQPSAAMTDFRKVQRIRPKDVDAIEQLAVLLRRQGRHEQAIEEFERASRLREPPPNSVLQARAECYKAGGVYDKAARDFALYYRLTGDRNTAIQEGESYIGLKKYEKAIEAFRKSMDPAGGEKMLEPRDLAFALTEQSLCYLRLKDVKKARELSTKSIELRPTHTASYLVRSQANIDLGNIDEAIADISQAIKLNKRLTFLYGERAKLYEKKGEWQLAKKDRMKLSEDSKDLKSDLMD